MKFSNAIQGVFLRATSALLNIAIVWIVVMHFGKEQAGNLLATNSGLMIVTYILNFGWDQAVITKNEKSFFILNIILIPIMFFLIMKILNHFYSFSGVLGNILHISPYILVTIFFIAVSANAQNILRISRASEKTYPAVLNYNMVGLLIATAFLENIELIIFFQAFFSCLILISTIYIVNRKLSFASEFIKPNFSYKLFPLQDLS
jgi:hypothetical protein